MSTRRLMRRSQKPLRQFILDELETQEVVTPSVLLRTYNYRHEPDTTKDSIAWTLKQLVAHGILAIVKHGHYAHASRQLGPREILRRTDPQKAAVFEIVLATSHKAVPIYYIEDQLARNPKYDVPPLSRKQLQNILDNLVRQGLLNRPARDQWRIPRELDALYNNGGEMSTAEEEIYPVGNASDGSAADDDEPDYVEDDENKPAWAKRKEAEAAVVNPFED